MENRLRVLKSELDFPDSANNPFESNNQFLKLNLELLLFF